MYEMAKSAREAMKSKARRLAGEPDRKVDSSTWTPSAPLNTEKKTGARPITKPSAKGVGESYAARDTKSSIGSTTRGAFKKGGAVKRDTGGRLPDPYEAMESETRRKNITATDTKMPAPEEAAERSGKTREDAPGRKSGGKANRPGRDLGGVMQVLSPAYAAVRALGRGGKDEERDAAEQAKGMAIANTMGRKSGGKAGNWIKDAIKKPGALHKSLGVKAGEKIPAKKLEAAEKKGGKLAKRAQLAETLRGLNKKDGGKVDKAKERIARARGGVTVVNIGRPGGAMGAPQMPPQAGGNPQLPPQAMGRPGMPPGAPGMAPLPPAAPPPAAMPPAMMPPAQMPAYKKGGRISKVAKSYKDMTAGSGSGEGRLQKTDIAKKRA